MKTLQFFTDEYLEQCKTMTPKQILDFQETFRELNTPSENSKSISMRIPENLLNAFKRKCELTSTKYQTQIKKIMEDWISKNDT